MPMSRYANTGIAVSVNMARDPAGGMKYFDWDGRSGRSGNLTGQPGTRPSTSLVPRPAVTTSTSDSTGPLSVATTQLPPTRVIARGGVFSATRTPRARRPSRSACVTAARSANPASTSSQPPSASNCGNRSASWAAVNASRRSCSRSSTA